MIYNILQLLEKNAAQNPAKTALSDGTGRSWDYGQYHEDARKIGTYIIRNTQKRGAACKCRPVAVLIDRNALSIVTFMGVAYSGNFYVPVDVTMPDERIELIFSVLDPVMVIDARYKEAVRGEFKLSVCADGNGTGTIPYVFADDIISGCKVLSAAAQALGGAEYEAPKDRPARGKAMDAAAQATGIAADEAPEDRPAGGKAMDAAAQATGSTSDEGLEGSGSGLPDEAGLRMLDEVRRRMIDTDPLYCIFTSGSTGIPKGVAVSHRSVIDLAEAFRDAFGFTQELIFGNQAPFDFDVSVKDIYCALYNNASIEVLPKKLFKLPGALVDYIKEKNISILIWAVSALRIVADFKTFEASQPPEGLRYIMFSGEVMPVKALNYWMDNVPEASYVNLYGPTEITCNCTYYKVTKRHADDEILPVGKPFTNSRVFLRDEAGEVIDQKNVVGEICVSGTCLALGYWNNPERTSAAFLQNPSISEYPSRMYATGDMGYYDADGNIVFASRRDFQIKHMGHRIELGEVEAALNSVPFVRVSCCLYDAKRERIVCFYEADSECRREIVLALSKKLPKYMWPNAFEWYESLPMNKNGKIDRALLGQKLAE